MYSLLLLLLLCPFLSLVYALPTKRDVWVPSITYPDNSTVWTAGGTYNVTWDTSSQPSQITNPIGLVYLRHDNLTQDTPIAQGFNLSDGVVNVTIPVATLPFADWIVVLFGDSGNFSPPFTIVVSS